MKSILILTAALTGLATAAADKKVETLAAKPVKAKKFKKASSYPLAFYHKKGFVISPFKPYNVLEVKHLKAGMLAYDPFTAKIDSNGKRNYDSAKIFRVPVNKAPVKKTSAQ